MQQMEHHLRVTMPQLAKNQAFKKMVFLCTLFLLNGQVLQANPQLKIHTSKKILHHLGSTGSGTFTYKLNRDPHKQHFSSFYCS
jgi:hypothetical protein